jgi:hypothetical protein
VNTFTVEILETEEISVVRYSWRMSPLHTRSQTPPLASRYFYTILLAQNPAIKALFTFLSHIFHSTYFIHLPDKILLHIKHGGG